MSNYVATDKPVNGSRNISKQVRDEFDLIETAIATKSDANSQSSVSTTSITIPTPTQTISFVMETGKEFVGGQTVFVADAALPATNNMSGTLLSYNSVTGATQVSVTSKNGSGTISSWIIGISNASGVTLGANTFTGAQNFARATVASAATTADIWAASGNQIDFTGTATVTGFPAASQAGSSRELICAGACSFTAGANMLIDGVASGSTVTCAANDVMIVRAVTLSQFRLTRQRYDGFPINAAKGGSVLMLLTGNGHGSTSTMIRRMTTTVTNSGEGVHWNYVDSATLGGTTTVLKPFVGSISYADKGSGIFGISVNSNQLTTAFASITNTNKLLIGEGISSTDSIAGTCYFNTGDVIRMHTDGSMTDLANGNFLRLEALF